MLCAKCGASSPTGAIFCGSCGSSLTSMQDAKSPVPAASEQVPSTAVPWQAADEMPTLRTPYEQPPVSPQINEFANVELPSQGMPVPSTPSELYQSQAPTIPSPISGANYPPQPAAMPVYPSGANYPPQPAAMPVYPSGANYPPQLAAMPVYPSGANYPPQPAAMPVYPSGANYPPQPAATPTYPNYPPQGATMPDAAYPGMLASGTYPGQPSQPNWNGYPNMAPQPVAAQPSKLIQPLPLWITIVSSIVVASVLAALTLFTGSDWAAGAQVAGIIALVLGLLMLIAFGVRAALGMLASTNTHRLSQVVCALLLAFLLLGYGAFGVAGQNTIHALQAHVLESQQQFQSAINEYQASGQGQPNSADIARTYDEWGEQLKNQQQFQNALNNFNTVITDYTQATAQVTQAQSDAISTYQAWGNQASQQKNYAEATQHYDDLLKQLYCDTPCKNSTKTLDATAYFNLGEQQLAAGNFATAASAFNTLTTDANLKNSPEASKVHGDFAKALFGEGKQALTTNCSNAVPIYQQLSANFSDTPEGQQATQALATPVQVKGHFTTTVPSGSNTPQVGLVQGISANMPSSQFYAILAQSPVQLVHSDGTFLFPSIKQGSYYLVWGTANTADNQVVFLVGQRYPAVVAPLCAFDFGDINETFPTA